MTKRTLVFEIGTEEMPSAPLYAATKKLAAQADEALTNARLAHGEVKTCSSPRRIILSVADVADATDALEQRSKGPSVKIAFDADGNPTKAAMGFARGKGLDVSQLERGTDEKGGEYVFAVVSEPAQPAVEILPDLLAGLIAGISWPRSQRWGSGHVTFVRPIRWLVCLLGDEVVPVEYAGLMAGRTTRGHRVLCPEPVEVASAETFFDHSDELHVIYSAEARADLIRKQVARLEEQTGLKAYMPKKTFDEVVNLVEWPTALLCHFDEEFLQVPPEIITDELLENQRYFPMYREDGMLDNAFVVVSNGNPTCSKTIADGNERVVRARLSDAAFFVAEDEHQPLESYVEGLSRVVFHEKLGTVYEKVNRMGAIAQAACEEAGFEGQEREDILRAVRLCKADLITSAVVEFTSLQGVMGGHYALASGENEAVALGITDHYRPRFAGDDLPRNDAGKIAALADKIDTICGMFAADEGPTGSSDPFAVRRSAIGVINILLSGLNVSLATLISASLAAYAEQIEFDLAATEQTVIEFFRTRLEVIAHDEGFAADAIQAVTATGMFEPVETLARIKALDNARSNDADTFDDLATAYTRAANLADATLGTEVDMSLVDESEKVLAEAVDVANFEVEKALEVHDHERAIDALAALRGPIDTFFTDVLVMDEDEAIRANRLRLLNKFVAVFGNVADVSKMARK